MDAQKRNIQKWMPLILVSFGQLFLWTVGTGFFGVTASIDGSTFYWAYFIGCALMCAAASISRSGVVGSVFWLGALLAFLGLFLAPAFNSIQLGLFASSALTFAGVVLFLAIECL